MSLLVNVISQVKKTIVFLGRITGEGEGNIAATGFLVSIENFVHLVTAKHVVMESREGKFTGRLIDEGLHAVLNAKDGTVTSRPIVNIRNEHGIEWMFHENEDVDIALIPFRVDTEKDDVKTIPDVLFLGTERLFELYDVFFLSFQPGVGQQQMVSPVARSGTISRINDDGSFYIDCSAFPGNSGSPVFLKPTPIRFDEEGISIGDPLGVRFVGVIGEYIAYSEVAISAQTGRPRVVFQENTGLSKVWSTTLLKEIMASEKFKRQIAKLQNLSVRSSS